MATIKDVAKEAGVSVATVSRVLNGKNVVTGKTEQRVMEAIRKLDYTPNMLGNSLRKAQTRSIIVLLPSVSNQFFSKILRGVEEQAKACGYYVMICMTLADRKTEEKYLELLKTKRVDGAIFMASTLRGEAITELAAHYPVVQCCEYVKDSHTSLVSVDDEKAGYDATMALIERGHRQIAFLGSSASGTSSDERMKGYLRALEENQIAISRQYMLKDTYSFNSGLRSAQKIAAMKKRPTAVFAVADSVAMGLVRGLRQARLRIPEDIAVIGFDDIAVASVFTPSLSTVSQPQLEIGKSAMRLLLNKMKDIHCEDQRIILEHRLILRETV